MNAENGWLTTIEGHSNKTYLYTLMPKATSAKKKCQYWSSFSLFDENTALLHKVDIKFTRLKHTNKHRRRKDVTCHSTM